MLAWKTESCAAAIHQSWSFIFFYIIGGWVSAKPRYNKTENERKWEFMWVFVMCVGTNLLPMSLGYSFAVQNLAIYGDENGSGAWPYSFLLGIVSSSLLIVGCTWVSPFLVSFKAGATRLWVQLKAREAARARRRNEERKVQAAAREAKAARDQRLAAVGLLPYLHQAGVGNDDQVLERANSWLGLGSRPSSSRRSVQDIIEFELVDDLVDALRLPAIPKKKLVAALKAHEAMPVVTDATDGWVDTEDCQTQTFMLTVPPTAGPGQQFRVSLLGYRSWVTTPDDARPGSTVFVDVSTRSAQTQLYRIAIPAGIEPGQEFDAMLGGERVRVAAPHDAPADSMLLVHRPRALQALRPEQVVRISTPRMVM